MWEWNKRVVREGFSKVILSRDLHELEKEHSRKEQRHDPETRTSLMCLMTSKKARVKDAL